MRNVLFLILVLCTIAPNAFAQPYHPGDVQQRITDERRHLTKNSRRMRKAIYSRQALRHRRENYRETQQQFRNEFGYDYQPQQLYNHTPGRYGYDNYGHDYERGYSSRHRPGYGYYQQPAPMPQTRMRRVRRHRAARPAPAQPQQPQMSQRDRIIMEQQVRYCLEKCNEVGNCRHTTCINACGGKQSYIWQQMCPPLQPAPTQ